MPLNLTQLLQDMDRLSTETWRRVMVGDASGLKFREDSITDQNLFELMECHPQLSVKRFSQNAEKGVGADWEWWVGSDGLGWFRLRIQAKRVHGASYSELDHLGAKEGCYQYQTLIDECEKKNATYPFHVFYNGWRENRFDKEFVSDHLEDCGSLARELWGCAAMSSHTVMKLHLGSKVKDWRKRSSVPRYMPNLLPWSRLFTFACANRHIANAPWWNNALPDEVFNEMHRAVVFADLLGRGDIPAGISTNPRDPSLYNFVDSVRRETTLHAELPGYAKKLRAAHRSFLYDGADYIEDNHNFRTDSYDDPFNERPPLVSVVDIESDREVLRWLQ